MLGSGCFWPVWHTGRGMEGILSGFWEPRSGFWEPRFWDPIRRNKWSRFDLSVHAWYMYSFWYIQFYTVCHHVWQFTNYHPECEYTYYYFWSFTIILTSMFEDLIRQQMSNLLSKNLLFYCFLFRYRNYNGPLQGPLWTNQCNGSPYHPCFLYIFTYILA